MFPVLATNKIVLYRFWFLYIKNGVLLPESWYPPSKTEKTLYLLEKIILEINTVCTVTDRRLYLQLSINLAGNSTLLCLFFFWCWEISCLVPVFGRCGWCVQMNPCLSYNLLASFLISHLLITVLFLNKNNTHSHSCYHLPIKILHFSGTFK